MISLEPIGIGRAASSHHHSGKDSNPAADFINGVATAAVSSSSSAGPGSAISSRHFSVEGSDLIHEVRIQPWQAVLGSDLLVPTLEGKVRLKIPPGTQGGQRFRLRERGLPGVSGKRGDLYVLVQINIPKKLTERERELWSELTNLHNG